MNKWIIHRLDSTLRSSSFLVTYDTPACTPPAIAIAIAITTAPLSVSPQYPTPRSHLTLKRGLGIGPIPGDKTTLFNTPWQRTRFLCGFHARDVGLLPLGNMTKLTGEDFICNGDRAACRIQITSRRFAEQTTIVPLLYEHRHLPLQSIQAITSLPTTPVSEFSLFRT